MIIESTNYFVGNASSQAVYSGNVVHFPNLVRVLSIIRTLNPPGGAALCSFKSRNMWPFFPPPCHAATTTMLCSRVQCFILALKKGSCNNFASGGTEVEFRLPGTFFYWTTLEN
jgi:hypothetical protein